MIIFVGDKPSKFNVRPEVAFVGTKSYKTLLDWIWKLDLGINNVLLCNLADVLDYQSFIIFEPFDGYALQHDPKHDKVIALGQNASKGLHSMGVEHFLMDHPSGLNRKLNDKNYVKRRLEDLKVFIND